MRLGNTCCSISRYIGAGLHTTNYRFTACNALSPRPAVYICFMKQKRPIIQSVPLSKLSADPANVRLHSPENIAAIKASLRRFGQQKPLVVDTSHVIRAGNGTFQAARELGWTHLDVVVTDLSGPDAIAYAIADNRTAELAHWDISALKNEFDSLDDVLHAATGFTIENLNQLAHSIPCGQPAPRDDIHEPVLPKFLELYELAVECRDEADQKKLYEQLAAQGRKVRVLTL